MKYKEFAGGTGCFGRFPSRRRYLWATIMAVTGSAVIWMLLGGGFLLVRTIRRDAQGREHLYATVAQPGLAHALGKDHDNDQRDNQFR